MLVGWLQEKEVATAQFRRAMNTAKAMGLVEQLLQHFILTDKAKKEMKMKLPVGSKKAEEAVAEAEAEEEEEPAAEEKPAAKKAATPRKKAASTKTASTKRAKAGSGSKKATGGGGKARSTAGTKRAASTKASGGRAKKAKTSTA